MAHHDKILEPWDIKKEKTRKDFRKRKQLVEEKNGKSNSIRLSAANLKCRGRGDTEQCLLNSL